MENHQPEDLRHENSQIIAEAHTLLAISIEDKTSAAIRSLRELKGFGKLSLAPGETKQVAFTLDKHFFAWYTILDLAAGAALQASMPLLI